MTYRLILVLLFAIALHDLAEAQDDFSLSTTAPAPQPAPAAEGPVVEAGLVETFAARFSPHEPIYFLWGPDDPQIKFQFSLKYQIFSAKGSWAEAAPLISGFHLAYSQTSFWDINSDSSPFFDTSYRPELLYLWERPNTHWLPNQSRFDLQLGLQHESNGRSGGTSRSYNIAYVRPVFTFGDTGKSGNIFLTIAPRIWAYVGSVEDNPDMAEYRGHGDLRIIVGQRDGLQLAAIARVGDDWDRGSIELDASYPLHKFTKGNLDLYLFAQYFNGYSESLLEYNQSTSAFRVGIALVR
ncbi:MAG TPA: phospholipase A [Tepidisphaeraceae bacterium]|jgi:outer membrane phospholipase A